MPQTTGKLHDRQQALQADMSELTPASHSIITFDRSAGDAYYEPLFPHNHQQHLSPKDHISNLRGENYRCLTLTTTSYQQHSPPGSPSYHSNHPQTIPQLPGLHVSHTTPRDEQKSRFTIGL